MTKEGKGHEVDAELKEKVEQILREVQTAQARKVKPTEVFKKISSYLKKEPALTIPVIEGLAKIPTSQTVQVLQRMMSSVQEKGVTKAAKRTLYRLRQKGVQWKDKTASERPVLRRPQPGVPQAYLGTMDSTGSRIVVVARPRPLGGVRVYFSIVNDSEGIQRFELNDLTKKGFKELIGGLLSSVEFPVVEAPAGYCVQILKGASEMSQRLATPLPPGYKDAERELQDVRWDGPVALIYQFIKEEEVKDQVRLLSESGNLHKILPFSSWFINPDEVRKYAEAIREADKSRIVMTPQQKDARLSSVYMEALHELFPEERRLLWKRRLEEVAYILWKIGKEREAKQALSAGVDLKTPFSPIEPNPFIWNLLLKSIYSLIKTDYEGKEEEQKASLIVTP